MTISAISPYFGVSQNKSLHKVLPQFSGHKTQAVPVPPVEDRFDYQFKRPVLNPPSPHKVEYYDLNTFFPRKSAGDLKATYSKWIGGLQAKNNIQMYEVAVKKFLGLGGNVTADGDIESLRSDVEGTLKAGGNIRATESAHIGAIEAGKQIDAYELAVDDTVKSKEGDINFISSNAEGKLYAPHGDVNVSFSDGVGGIQAGGNVTVQQTSKVPGKIVSGGNVTLRGQAGDHFTKVRNIKLTSTGSVVDIGPFSTVTGNIDFPNGEGEVVVQPGGQLKGSTNGRIKYESAAPGYNSRPSSLKDGKGAPILKQAPLAVKDESAGEPSTSIAHKSTLPPDYVSDDEADTVIKEEKKA